MSFFKSPLEDLVQIQKEQEQIEKMVRRNVEAGTFPFIAVRFDGDYAFLQGVVEAMGYHVRGRTVSERMERLIGVVICASPEDTRRPHVQYMTLGQPASLNWHEMPKEEMVELSGGPFPADLGTFVKKEST